MYVVLATLSLQTGCGDPGPIAADYALSLPNEPLDPEEADLNDVEGAQVSNIRLEGVTALWQYGGSMSGSATLACHELGQPRDADGWNFATTPGSSRSQSTVVNDLNTTGCRGVAALAGAR